VLVLVLETMFFEHKNEYRYAEYEYDMQFLTGNYCIDYRRFDYDYEDE
jgi:hypothetical protein